ncbi:hypothetical protein AMTR_s00027p00220230 [Amborella trichopoda]|uniref:Aminotransferase-like plant mobile domain-containing protein n=1 Tax=Amborella trichopoda TaxID=13333 RepID=W1PRX3_AMBTC|nr:hypothetical protein AMTR_s00027p00220230 [Amborella trichopoda]
MTHHDRGILSTIIERWPIETNTGHFNIDIREMMPTLEDVWKILRLNVTGVAVTLRRVENYGDYIVHMIGELPPGLSHSIIRLMWLRNTFKRYPHNYNLTTLLQHTCAYLLYLVGCTIFADSTDGTVSTICLQPFEDIETTGQYAWGAVALFQGLSKVVRPEAVRDEDESEELELDDEMEDNVLLVWLPARPDEGPSNTQPIPILVHPEELKWQLRPRLAIREESSLQQESRSNTEL